MVVLVVYCTNVLPGPGINKLIILATSKKIENTNKLNKYFSICAIPFCLPLAAGKKEKQTSLFSKPNTE